MFNSLNIASELRNLLAELSVFESNLNNCVPGELTHEQIDELGDEYVEIAEPLIEMIKYFGTHEECSDLIGTDIVKSIDATVRVANIFVELKQGANKVKAN